MGANISQLERDIGQDQFPPERYFGLVNVSSRGNKLKSIFICISVTHLTFSLVWKHLLLELSAAGVVLLQALS